MAKISIITPYRNAAQFLPGLVHTLKNQSYGHWECLLIDDNSQDQGAELVAELTATDGRFRLLSLAPQPINAIQNRLPARPRNLGLHYATSPLIAFLDVDDLWHPQKLERQLSFHRSNRLDLSVTAYGRFRWMDQPIAALRCPPTQLSLSQLQQRNPIPLLSVLIRKDLLSSGFIHTHHEDYLQWLNLRRDHPGLRYGCLNEVLAFYRLHDGNLTSRRPALMAWTYRVFRLHGLTRRKSIGQALRWGISQGSTLLQEFLQRQEHLPTAVDLLHSMPPQTVPLR